VLKRAPPAPPPQESSDQRSGTAAFLVNSAYDDMAPVKGSSVVIAAAQPRSVSPWRRSATPMSCGNRRASSLGIVPANLPPSILSRNDGTFSTVHSAPGPPSLTWTSSDLMRSATGVFAPSYVRTVPVHSPESSVGAANAATAGGFAGRTGAL